MKVWIAYPPLSGKGSPMLTQNRQFQWYNVPSYIYPVVSASAATLLAREGFQVTWADGITNRWSYEDFLRRFDAEQPDLVALETKTPVVRQHWRIVDDLKTRSPRTMIALMGDHVTARPEESLVKCRADYVITGGHYDLALLGAAQSIRNDGPMPSGIWYRDGSILTNSGPFSQEIDLNALPYIDRVLTQADLYGEKWKKRTPFFYTMAGRDCHWGKCTFCAWTTLFPQFSMRSPENLLDEIGCLIESHGVKELFDDSGTLPAGSWLDHFCNGMIDRGYNKEVLFSCNMRYGTLTSEQPELMKKAGFRKLKMGLESANQSTLDRISKGIKVQQIIDGSKEISDAGLDIQLTVMVGYPWETRTDAQRTIDLANQLMANGHAEMLQATFLVPYPGTPLYEEALTQGWFRIDPLDYDRFDMSETVFNLPDMPPEAAKELCSAVYRSFLSPRYILRHLRRIRSLDDIKYIGRGAISVLGHLADFSKRREKR